MEFPHLADTNFPNFENVNVYSFKNEFDYTRWIPQTNIYLTNVLWDSDYNDVVKFETNEARDNYFDTLSDTYKETLETDARIVPDGYVKLPIPYDVMARYNYLYIDLPIATSTSQMIDYENNTGVHRWYFFIDNIRYMAPNTTEVFLTFDVWTNFINDMRFTYAVLERGHAPVKAIDTDTYLNDPINNCEYLLADDVNFGTPDIVKNSRYIPVGNGEKYLCFVLNAEFTAAFANDFGRLFSDTYSTYNRPLTYSNVICRQGYQLQVNNYGIGNGYNYSNVNTPVSDGINSSENVVPNNVTCIAVKASECIGDTNFLQYMKDNYPSFFNTIQACFMASSDMVKVTAYIRLSAGYTIYNVRKNNQTIDGIKLTKNMFNFPAEYERFTKLYTMPYSCIELSDDNGSIAEVAIENISKDNEIHSDFSFAYPYLNARIFFTGIGYNGNGVNTYAWKLLDGQSLVGETPISEWAKYLFEFDIPTYALFMDGQTAYNMRNYNRGIANAKLQALTAYHTNVRDANTAYENAIADHNTSYKNAVNLAKTNRINADNLATTIRYNEYNKIPLGTTATNNSTKASDANLAISNVGSAANVEQALYASLDNAVMEVNKAWYFNDYTNTLSQANVVVDSDAVLATTMNNASYGAAGTVLASAAELATTGGILGTTVFPAVGTAAGAGIGLALGFGKGLIQASMNYIPTQTNANLVYEANQTRTTNIINTNNTFATVNRSFTAKAQENTNRINELQADNSFISGVLQNDNNITLSKQTQANINSYVERVAQDNYNTSVTNNNNTRNVLTTNADNTVNNANSNSLYTRENTILNLKEILETAQDVAQNAIKDAKNEKASEFGIYSGDMSGDVYTNKGVRIRIKTQNKSAIKQTADYFARYGYSLNQIWDIETSGLNIMKHFTYWKCSDVWIDDIQASNNLTQKTISDIMKKGVTVWNNPDEIGKVGVFNNE